MKSDESVPYLKVSYLDASAAVKLVLKEPGSGNMKQYFAGRGGFYITTLCLAEALGVLKRKWLKGDLTQHQYFGCCYLLLNYLGSSRIHLDDTDLGSWDTFSKAEEIARRHTLDLSDSLQLVTVKHGNFRYLVQESKTVLVTADRDLALAAKQEGLRVWNCEQELEPPPE